MLQGIDCSLQEVFSAPGSGDVLGNLGTKMLGFDVDGSLVRSWDFCTGMVDTISEVSEVIGFR